MEFHLGDHGRDDPVRVTIAGLFEVLPLDESETCCSVTVVGPDTFCPLELRTTTFACNVLLLFVRRVFWMVWFANQPHIPTMAARAPETKSHLMEVNKGYLLLDFILSSMLVKSAAHMPIFTISGRRRMQTSRRKMNWLAARRQLAHEGSPGRYHHFETQLRRRAIVGIRPHPSHI